MPTTLAKPRNSSIGGGDIGISGSKYKIKVTNVDTDFYTPLVESTGDGDSSPDYEESLIYGNISFRGFVPGSGNIGIANLTAGTSITVDLTLDTGRTINGTVKIGQISLRTAKRGNGIPLAISGKYTSNLASGSAETAP